MELELNNEGQPAHTIDFVSDASTTLKAWREFSEKKFKQKLSKNSGMYVAESVMISELSTGPISIYSNVEERSKGSQLQVWVKSGESYASHSNLPEISQRIDAAMTNFANQFYNKHYGMAIAFQQEEKKNVADELSSLEKEKESLAKDQKKNKEDIDDNQEEIDDLQEKINELEKENKNLKQENQELAKEQEKNKKAVAEKQQLLEKKDTELQNLKSNSEKYK
jgi:DNA repair exonuclease SbcCD ATPase subunit